MNGKGYATNILPLIREHCGQELDWMLDNPSPHTSDDAAKEIARLGLEPMPWPATARTSTPSRRCGSK
jgi:hypothetical protein